MLPPPVPTPLPRHHRPGDRGPARRDDHAGQPLLHVPPQRRIDRQSCRLRPARGAIRMPLRRRRSVLEAAAARGGVAAQLPRDRRRRPRQRRAISRTPCPWARQSAISSRSVNARYRPDGGGVPTARCDGGMPPASRNHRTPTAGDTPRDRRVLTRAPRRNRRPEPPPLLTPPHRGSAWRAQLASPCPIRTAVSASSSQPLP